MSKMIFVNLPVRDLEASMRFYTTLGFVNEPRFTDGTGACMVWSEAIFVMLLTHEKWAGFTDRPIPDAGSSEVMLALAVESRAAVDAMVETVRAQGGTPDVNPPQDHGFMMSRAFADLDGHVWEPFWMDPVAAENGPPPQN